MTSWRGGHGGVMAMTGPCVCLSGRASGPGGAGRRRGGGRARLEARGGAPASARAGGIPLLAPRPSPVPRILTPPTHAPHPELRCNKLLAPARRAGPSRACRKCGHDPHPPSAPRTIPHPHPPHLPQTPPPPHSLPRSQPPRPPAALPRSAPAPGRPRSAPARATRAGETALAHPRRRAPRCLGPSTPRGRIPPPPPPAPPRVTYR